MYRGLCEGSLYNFNLQALEGTEYQIKAALTQKPLIHADESGIRIEGKLHWLHSVSTPDLTFYQHHKKRGSVAMDVIGILPDYPCIIVHDHLKAYLTYADCLHSLCNAHYLCELVFLLERGELLWADEMIRLLVVMKKCTDRAKARQQHTLYPALSHLLLQRYDKVLEAGFKQDKSLPINEPNLSLPKKRGRKKQSKSKNLLDRLQNYKTETLRFLTDFSIPFDNNQAERDIRMIKLKQKISGTFRSDQGAKLFFRIRGYL